MPEANPVRPATRRLLLAPILALIALGVVAADAAAQQEAPLEILAVRVREQGHPCEKPIKAERDERASKPLSTVWFLQCSNARYRLVLHPDMGADIEVLN